MRFFGFQDFGLCSLFLSPTFARLKADQGCHFATENNDIIHFNLAHFFFEFEVISLNPSIRLKNKC